VFLQKRLNDRDSEINYLNLSLKGQKNFVDSAKLDLSALNEVKIASAKRADMITELTKKMAVLSKEIETLNVSIAKKDEFIENLTAKKEKFERELQDLRNNLARMVGSVSSSNEKEKNASAKRSDKAH